MEISFPNLVNAALPVRDKKGRNAIILSNNMGPNHNEQGFLSRDFPRSPPKLYITAESDDFDELTLREWRDEGFHVEYLPMGDSTKEYKAKLASLKTQSDLGPCENYGIVAYGDAAGICLEYFHIMDNNPEFKLGCLVAYYPTQIPDTRAQFPSAVQVLVHLAGKEVDVVSHSQLVGIQGKRRVTKRKVERGLGVGGLSKLAYPCYTYDAEPGFAEHDLDEYDKIGAELAWSRSLAAVRRAFRMDVDHEMVVEENVENKFYTRNLGQTLSTYTTQKSPHVTYFPTLTGGIGAQELRRFYSDYFLSTNPPSTKLTLLSRTIGGDRVVDELHVAFKHTQEMPWILPGVPPTNKRVEVMVISIVTLRGGKLYHEHVYWDQASVLVQVGLLDPKLVSDKAKGKGVTELPVVGREAARRVISGFDDEEDGEADNELIPGWYDDDDDDDDVYDDSEPEPEENSARQTQNGKGKEVERPTPKEPEQPKEQKKQKESKPLMRNGNSNKVEDPTPEEPEEPKEVKEQKEQSEPKPSTRNENSKKVENPTPKEPEQPKEQVKQKKTKPSERNTNGEEVGNPTPKGPEEPKEPSGQKKTTESKASPWSANGNEDEKPAADAPEEPKQGEKPEEQQESTPSTANVSGEEVETPKPKEPEEPKEQNGSEPSTLDTYDSDVENPTLKEPEEPKEQEEPKEAKDTAPSTQLENGDDRGAKENEEPPADTNGVASEENPNGER